MKQSRIFFGSIFFCLILTFIQCSCADDPLILDFDQDDELVDSNEDFSGQWAPVQSDPEGALPPNIINMAHYAARYLYSQAFRDWGSVGLKLELAFPTEIAQLQQWLIAIRVMAADFIDYGIFQKYRITADFVNPMYYHADAISRISDTLGADVTQRYFTEWFSQLPNANRETLNRIPLADRQDYVIACLMAVDPKKFTLLYQEEGLPGSTVERWTFVLTFTPSEEPGSRAKMIHTEFVEEFDLSDVLVEYYSSENPE